MILRTGVLGIMFLSMPALAINGEVRAATKTYDIELKKEDIVNEVGARQIGILSINLFITRQ